MLAYPLPFSLCYFLAGTHTEVIATIGPRLMGEMSSQKSRLRSILKQELARLKEGAITREELPDDLPLFDLYEDGSHNLGLDSLDALELAMAIEEKCGVKVPMDVDFKELATINDIVAYVTRLGEQQGRDGIG